MKYIFSVLLLNMLLCLGSWYPAIAADHRIAVDVKEGNVSNTSVRAKRFPGPSVLGILTSPTNPPAPTNASTVTFQVMFTTNVSNVTTDAFGLVTSGTITGAYVQSASGAGPFAYVTVFTGTGDGTIALVVNGTNLSPAFDNLPFTSTSDHSYTIDRTAPQLSLGMDPGTPYIRTSMNNQVTLITTATDNVDKVWDMQIRYSNDNVTWTAFQGLGPFRPFYLLTPGDGPKTVYAQVKDRAGNVTSASYSVIVDNAPVNINFTSFPPPINNQSSVTVKYSTNKTNIKTYHITYDGSSFDDPTGEMTFPNIQEGTHSFAVSAEDLAGNQSGQISTMWTTDLTAPVVASVAMPSAGKYNPGQGLFFVVKFSENVKSTNSNFPYLDVMIGGKARKADYYSGQATDTWTFRYVVQDDDYDPVGIQLGSTLQQNGNVLTDQASNPIDPTLNNISPNVVLVGNKPVTGSFGPTVNQSATTIQMTVNFGEEVTGLDPSQIQLQGVPGASVMGMVPGSAVPTNSYTFNVILPGSVMTTLDVTVPSKSVTSTTTGGFNPVISTSMSINNILPSIISVSGPSAGYYKAGQVLNFVVYCNKAVNVAATTDPLYLGLNIGGANVQANYVSGNGTNALLFSYTVQQGDNDNIGITLANQLTDPNGRIKDDYNSPIIPTIFGPNPVNGVKVNTIMPMVSFATSAISPVNGPFNLTIRFSEPVQGLGVNSFVLINCTMSNLSSTNNKDFTATITPLADGLVAVNLPQNQVTNIGGNGNVSGNFYLYADITPPVTTTVTGPANGIYTVGNVLTFNVNFSEAINIIPGSGTPYLPVNLSNGSRQAAYVSSSSTSLTFAYVVQPGDEAMGGISIDSINLGGTATIKDQAGNNALLALNNVPDLSQVKIHTAKPSVTISTTAGPAINGPAPITITFSEAVSSFTAMSLQVTNGTISNFSTTDNITYTALFTPSVDGQVKIIIPADAAMNIANNGNTASNLLLLTADMTSPSVLSVNGPANGYYREGDVLTFNVIFSEPIIVNRGAGNPYLAVNMTSGVGPAYFVSSSGNTAIFSYTVQPGDEAMTGISMGAGISLGGADGIKDLAGNDANLVITNLPDLSQVKIHTAYPNVTLSTTAVSPVNGPFAMNIIFSEPVTGFTSAGIIISNATIGAITTTDNITYSTIITPINDGTVYFTIRPNAAVNVVNNGNLPPHDLMLMADVTPPSITALTIPAAAWYKTGDNLDFTLTYSENVILSGGNTYLPLQIGASTVKANYLSGSGTNTLTFRYTVQSGDQAPNGITYTPQLQTGTDIYSDKAGNPAPTNLPVVSTSNVKINTVVTPIMAISIPASGIYNTGRKLNFTIVWTNTVNVTGTPRWPIIIGNQTVYADYQSGTGTNGLLFSYTIVDGDNDMDGIDIGNVIQLNGGTITSGGLNAALLLTGVPNTHRILVNTMHPDVVLSANIPTRINTAFTVNATFSEAVTGLTIAGIQATNGSISALQTTDNIHYTFIVTPAADGNVLVTIPANAAQNIGNNGNKAANTLQVTADITAPVITAGQQFQANEYSAASTTVGQIIATDASNILQNWAMSDPSGVFTMDAATGMITVKDAALLNTKINTTIPVTVTVSDGLNTSLPTIINIAVLYVPLPPTDISISNTSISENTATGTVIGQLSSTTAEPGATFTYTLAAGTGGVDNAAFSISGNQLQNSKVFKYAVQKTYSVRIRTTQANGLYFEKVFNVQVLQVNQAPVLDPIASQAICSTIDKQKLQLTGGSPVETDQTLSYTVKADPSFFNTLTIDNSGLISYSLKPNVTGNVQITVTLKDNGGTANQGVDTLVRSFNLTVNPLPQVTIIADKTGVISKGDIVRLTATGGTTYVWTNADGILGGQQSSTLQVRPGQNTTYEVTASNAAGCSSIQQINIAVVADFKVEATNLLTPNGDGINDKWVIRNLDSYPQNEVTIFDRSGRMVYHKQNYSNDWDGKLNGQPLSEGTYYYILKINGTDKVAKGFITILQH